MTGREAQRYSFGAIGPGWKNDRNRLGAVGRARQACERSETDEQADEPDKEATTG